MTDWDGILDQMDYEDRVKRDARFDEDPDRVARVSRVADATGLPVDMADRNLDELEAKQRIASLDLGKMFDEQPATGRLIRDHGAIAHDEIEDLRDTEERIGTASNLTRTFGDRLSELGANVLQSFGTLAEPIERASEKYLGGIPTITVGRDGIGFDMQTADQASRSSAARQFGQTLEDVDLGSEARFTWEQLKQEPSIGNLVGYVGEAGAASLADMLVAMTGSVGAASYVAGRSQEMAEGRAENIYGRDVDAALLFEVMPAAIAETALERIGGKSILDVGGVRTAGQAARATGRALFREGATEFVQENIDYAATTAGTDVDMSIIEGFDRGFAAMVAGSGMGATLRGTTASIELAANRITRSTNEQAIIDEMMGLADRTKLRERDVRAYQNYMQDLAQTYGIDTVSIDAESQYFQSNPDSPLLENLVGDDVQMDVADFMALDTETREAMRPDVRLQPDSSSQMELQSFEEAQTADIAVMISKAQESVKEFTRSQEIYRQVADQIRDTGAYGAFTANLMAHLYPAYVVTKAKNEGLTVDDVWSQMGVAFEPLDTRELSIAQVSQDPGLVLEQPPLALAPAPDGGHKAAQTYGYENFAGKSFRSDALDADVSIGRKHVRKALHRSGPDLLAAFYAIPELIQKARLESSEPGTASDMKAFHRLAADVEIDGRQFTVHIGVREMADGRYMWGLSGEAGEPGRSQFLDAESGDKGLALDPASDSDQGSALDRDNQDDTDPDFFVQPGESSARGNIQLFPDRAVIRLGAASDQSTFFHESGHLFLEMERRFAESESATDRQKADFKTILDFLGVESADQIETEHHEKFARAFESYIGEGKAPSLELRTVFRRFAQWIVRIYRTLTALDVELTDDIRGVMDRMLATEEQIERAAASFSFDIAAPDGENDGKAAAKENLRTKLVKAIKREKDKEWKAERANLAERIELELAEEKVYQAMDVLSDLKVDRAEVVEILGVKNLQKVPQLRGMTIKDGESVDDVAQLVGYPSGQAMLDAIMSAPKIKDAAMERAQQRMLEKHGDPMDQIEALADQAMHNEEMARQLISELRALNPREQKIDRAPIREYAKAYIGAMRTADIKPLAFQRAEVKAARAYERALAEGDKDMAIQHKQDQILQFYLVREAMAAQAKIERMRKVLKGYQDREYRDTEVAPEYAQNLRTYARLYDFRKGQGNLQNALLIDAWIKSQIEDENQFIKPQVFDLVMIRMAEQIKSGEQFVMPSWRDMTLDEFTGVYDQAKHFRWLGGQMSDRSRARRKDEAKRLANSIAENSKGEVVRPDVITNLHRNRSIIKRFMADHLRLRNVVALFDGGKSGIAKAKLYDPLAEAANNEVDMNMALAKDVEALFKPMEAKLFRRGKSLRTVQKEDGGEWTLGLRERIMLALYWGTPESRQAILDGHGVTEGDAQRMLDNLSNEEIDLVEGIWKLNDSLWPKFSGVMTRLYGASPAKVEKSGFSVRNRKMSGGYMRLYYEYDSKDSSRADLHETAQDVFKGGTSISMSKPGSAHARVGSGGRRVSLELNNITMALEENIHTIAFGEVSRDVARLAKDKGVAAAIIKGHGEERYQALIDTLDGIVSGDLPGSTGIEKWMRYVRTNLTFGYLAFSVRNFVQQPVAMTNVIGKVGEVRAVSAMLSVMRRPKYWMQFATERSTFMRHRLAFVNREAAEQLSHISTNSTNSWLKRHAFDLQTIGDAFVAYPAWVAGYREGLEIYADEAQATRHADDIVAATVGSGMVKDLSPILMGGGGVGKRLGKEAVKQLTFMGSFFNVVYNLVDESYRKTNFKNPKQVAEFSREMAWYLVAPALISKAVVSSLWGEDEDEGFWEWAAKSVGEYGLGSVFLLRDLASALNGFKPSVPFQSAPSGIARAVGEIGELIEEGEINDEDVPAMIRSMQPLVPLPGSGQVARFMDYLSSHSDGNEGDFNLYDALVEGKERDK